MVCLEHKTIKEVCRALYVSHSTVERVVQLYRTTGDVTRVQQKPGPDTTLSETDELVFLDLMLRYPGIFLREVQEQLCQITGTWVDCSTLCRTAKRLGLTRQKMRKVAIQRSDSLRAQYMAEIQAFNPDMLIFVDETGCDKRKSCRQYGYGIRGITPVNDHFLI